MCQAHGNKDNEQCLDPINQLYVEDTIEELMVSEEKKTLEFKLLISLHINI